MNMAFRKFKLALIQFFATANKNENLSKITNLVKKASEGGAQVISLPECCNSPYSHKYFSQLSESIPGESTEILSKAASENNVYLFGGSIIERRDNKLYNTYTVFGPDGELLAKYNKLHLFDVDVPGKISFQESKSLSAGNSLTILDLPFCKVGLGICYDVVFPELAQLYAKHGCKLLMYCGAFPKSFGRSHWELLSRATAFGNQVYFCNNSLARDNSAPFVSYGHSLAIDPWGKVIASTDEKEDIIYADIDLDYLDEVRQNMPVLRHKRNDLYNIESNAIKVYKTQQPTEVHQRRLVQH